MYIPYIHFCFFFWEGLGAVSAAKGDSGWLLSGRLIQPRVRDYLLLRVGVPYVLVLCAAKEGKSEGEDGDSRFMQEFGRRYLGKAMLWCHDPKPHAPSRSLPPPSFPSCAKGVLPFVQPPQDASPVGTGHPLPRRAMIFPAGTYRTPRAISPRHTRPSEGPGPRRWGLGCEDAGISPVPRVDTKHAGRVFLPECLHIPPFNRMLSPRFLSASQRCSAREIHGGRWARFGMDLLCR